jgi:hypothetical protein
MARIRLLPSIESAGRESEPRHLRSRAILGPTVTLVTPSRPDDEQKELITTVTIAHSTMTIVGTGGATIATTTATAAGHRTSDDRGP